MLDKIISFIVVSVCITFFALLLIALASLEQRKEQECKEKGMIYVQPRGDRGYCTVGFRP